MNQNMTFFQIAVVPTPKLNGSKIGFWCMWKPKLLYNPNTVIYIQVATCLQRTSLH